MFFATGSAAPAGDANQPAKTGKVAGKKTASKPARDASQPPKTGEAAGTKTTSEPARDAKQPQKTGETAGTKTASEGVKITLRIPITSPLFSQFPVALANDEPITMADLVQTIGSTHAGKDDDKTKAGAIDYTKILDRLINARLVAQEAVNIGFDEEPQCKDALESNAKATLAVLLMDDLSKDVKAEPSEVEDYLKKTVEEWKITSVLFEKEDDAKTMEDAIKAGKPFDELAKKAVADKKAKGGGEGEYMKPKDMLPEIVSAASALSIGSVSPAIKLDSGKNQRFAILKLLDKRYPETPEARMRAEQAVLESKKFRAINEYKKMLFSKYVTIKGRRVDGLDYDSPKANLQRLLADTTVLAEIKEGDPVTVGDLTRALADKFYHGLEEAAKQKRINEVKREVLNLVIERRLVRAEASRRGLDKSEKYRTPLRDYKNNFLFGMFIDKVVVPDIKIKEDDLQAYFQDHKQEYRYPEMMKMSGLAFGTKRDAGAALAKLKKGADINWVRANAEGLADTSDEDNPFGRSIMTTKSMPQDLRDVVAGARQGDFRIYPAPDGRFYVVAIQEIIPPRQQTFEEVKNGIQKKVFDIKLNGALEDWFSKLRAASEIKVYLSRKNN
jgi:parvulin-like peptidyl-prolyl isomerase